MDATAIILAAGEGTRMKSNHCKVSHKILGKPMVQWIVDATIKAGCSRVVVVIGSHADEMRDLIDGAYATSATKVECVEQTERLGTGHAVKVALEACGITQGPVVVLNGDLPLITADTVAKFAQTVATGELACTVMTMTPPDPFGYGRIKLGADGQIERIIEQKDCTPEQAALKEFNAGIYVFDADALRAGLASLTTNNAQGELYLTDVIAFAKRQGGHVHPLVMADRWEAEGVNDRAQLATLSRIKFSRIADAWMREGVTILDPATTWIEDSVDIEPDVTILPNTHLEGATTVRRGATIGPDTTLRDAEVGERATVVRTHGNLATIGADASVGPFAHLRPGTEIGDRAKVGAFVELRATIVDADGRVPALTSRDDHGPHDGPAAARAFEQN